MQTNMYFQGSTKKAKKESVCDKIKKCVVCNKRKEEGHICGYSKCDNCKEQVQQPHYCYMQKTDKDPAKLKLIFADFECSQEEVAGTSRLGPTFRHAVNLAAAIAVSLIK